MKLTNWIILISVMGGFVLSSAHATTVANPASVEYVDMQDAKLQYQIDHLEPFVPNSAYTLGQPLCTTTPTASCSGAGDQWGIVIYVDPNPTVSGYTAIAMAVANVSGTVVWGVSPATTTEVGADHYGMYGGISNTEAYTSYCTTNSCLAGSGFEACSAFNAGGFTDWYFPAIGEVMAMFGIAEQFSYGDDAISPPMFSIFTASYLSSTENNGYGKSGAALPDTQSLYFGFQTGAQGAGGKIEAGRSLRCVRAL